MSAEDLLDHDAAEERRFDDDPARDPEWLPSWYLAKIAELDGLEAAIKEQYERRIAQVNARRYALSFRWLARFRACVEADLAAAGGKRKSFDYDTGRAGFRKTQPKLDILDPDVTLAWCKRHLPVAVVTKETLDKRAISESGMLPDGAKIIPATDKFYPV